MVGNLVEFVRLNKNILQASSYSYMLKHGEGTVSSNSRFQTVLFQQYAANLSIQMAQHDACSTMPRGVTYISELRKYD